MDYPKSALTHLQCSYTGDVVEADRPVRLSPAGKVLFARYDLEAASRTFICLLTSVSCPPSPTQRERGRG